MVYRRIGKGALKFTAPSNLAKTDGVDRFRSVHAFEGKTFVEWEGRARLGTSSAFSPAAIASLDPYGDVNSLHYFYLHPQPMPMAVTPSEDGGIYTFFNGSYVYRHNATLTEAWNRTCVEANVGPDYTVPSAGIVRLADTTVAVVVQRKGKKGSAYCRFHSNGAPITKQPTLIIPSSAVTTTSRGALHLGGSRLAWTGTQIDDKGAKSGYLQLMTALGKPEKRVAFTDVSLNFSAKTDSGVVLVGTKSVAGNNRPALVWTDNYGGDTKQTTVANVTLGKLVAAQRVGGGGILLAVNSSEGFQTFVDLHLLSPNGKLQWTRKITNGPTLALHDQGLAAGPRGLYVVGATKSSSGAEQAFLAALSPWGQTSCLTVGKCVDLKGGLFAACAAKCGSKTPDCDPAVGCVCK